MIEHDLLCPYTGTMHSVACECPTIERARADERERIARAIEAHGAHLRISDAPVILRSVAAQIARNGGAPK